MANEEYLNNFNSLYDKFYAKLNQPAVEYKPQSLSTLKDALTKVIRPSYDKQIGNVKKSSAEGRASISADAGRRGLGSSTVVSDLLNRNRNAEAENINNINSDYLAALYSALMNQKNAQDEMSMSAQQANAQARQNASSQALGLAQNAYDRVFEPVKTGGGGGGYRGRSGNNGNNGDNGNLGDFGDTGDTGTTSSGMQNPLAYKYEQQQKQQQAAITAAQAAGSKSMQNPLAYKAEQQKKQQQKNKNAISNMKIGAKTGYYSK